MDIPRTASKRKRIIRRILTMLIILIGIGGISLALSKLEPAAPVVDRAQILIDIVKRDDMIRLVGGPGSLVPIDIRWISPSSSGRVEKRPIQPGTWVQKDTVIIELSNPEVVLDAEDAKLKLRSAESQYESRKVELNNMLLNLETSSAQMEANYAEAKLKAQSEEELAKDGLIPVLQLKVTKVRAEELAKLREIEQKRVTVQRDFSKTQLEVLKTQVDQANALYELKKKQVENLLVRAGFEGVLTQLLVEEGQQVAPATNLAKVSDPTRLKAVLRIDQNQVREVQTGMKAKIDLRNSVLNGHVIRIDPTVQEGTVQVDIMLDDPLPQGARPDQTLDGTIEIEKLTKILFVGRPVYAQPGGTVGLFKLTEDGKGAIRVPVKMGRSSVHTIEILSGLKEGDQIIRSDMNQWDKVDRIRLR